MQSMNKNLGKMLAITFLILAGAFGSLLIFIPVGGS